jgi:hypothetical protein
MSQTAIIGAVVLMMCCSSSVGAFFLIPSEAATGPTGPTGPTGGGGSSTEVCTYTIERQNDRMGGNMSGGGDGIEKSDCEDICTNLDDCVGFSYFENGRRCIPKQQEGLKNWGGSPGVDEGGWQFYTKNCQ